MSCHRLHHCNLAVFKNPLHPTHRGIQMAAEKKGGNLPPVLYLQLDNCWRENKNTTMFGYLSWLVHMRYFLKICVGFLLVGYVVRQRIRRMHTPAFHSQPWGSFWPGTSFDNASGGCTRLPFTRNPGCQTLRKAKNIFKTKQGFLTRSSIYIFLQAHQVRVRPGVQSSLDLPATPQRQDSAAIEGRVRGFVGGP